MGREARFIGFTLVECLAVLAICGFLVTVGVPAMGAFLDKQRVDAFAHQVFRMLSGAREAAVTSGRRMTFCGVDAAGVCVNDGIRAFTVFDDHDYDHRADPDEELKTHFSLPPAVEAQLHASNTVHISFRADGSAITYGSVYLCSATNTPQLNRRVSVHAMGRPYVELDRDGSGIVEDTDACSAEK